MIDDVTNKVALQVTELKCDPSDTVLTAILNYSKSIEVVTIAEQKIILNFN